MVKIGEDARPPSVSVLALSLAGTSLPHPLLVEASRAAIAAGDPSSAQRRAQELERSLLHPVINATGVLLHTNLGRAPLAIHNDARAWNLELDLATGRRGSRGANAAALLARNVGAESALVTNNGAAAVLLALTAMARARPVIVSRGELIEIGGGFRIPELLSMTGSTLIEVGTTNRTHRYDYEAALELHPDAALILKVHQSNYRMVGFTHSVGVEELASLGVPVIADIGSGLLDAETQWLSGGPPAWLAGEPAARQTLEQGATVVTFSGDKLLGGPQAGIIAGSADAITACSLHPLARALRPGVHVLRALQEVALAYLRRDGEAIPFWRMATATLAELQARAAKIAATGGATVIDCQSVVGGGSLPGVEIASAGIALNGDLTTALRHADPPVIARVETGKTICDIRSVDPDADHLLAMAVLATHGER